MYFLGFYFTVYFDSGKSTKAKQTKKQSILYWIAIKHVFFTIESPEKYFLIFKKKTIGSCFLYQPIIKNLKQNGDLPQHCLHFRINNCTCCILFIY